MGGRGGTGLLLLVLDTMSEYGGMDDIRFCRHRPRTGWASARMWVSVDLGIGFRPRSRCRSLGGIDGGWDLR